MYICISDAYLFMNCGCRQVKYSNCLPLLTDSLYCQLCVFIYLHIFILRCIFCVVFSVIHCNGCIPIKYSVVIDFF